MKKMYNINDLVKYQGDLDIFSNTFAKIIEFDSFHNVEKVHLLSINNNQKFWCDYNEIEHILLEEKHLINLGFKKHEIGEKLPKFTLNNIIVSSCSILENDENADASLFISGFVLGDLTVLTDFEKYICENKIDSEKFYIDFPKMYTLSSLLHYFKKNNVEFDEVEVSRL